MGRLRPQIICQRNLCIQLSVEWYHSGSLTKATVFREISRLGLEIIQICKKMVDSHTGVKQESKGRALDSGTG